VAFSTKASIVGCNELIANFTNSAAVTNVTWSQPDKILVSTNGLGWSGAANTSCDFWIQSIPLGIGKAWRPAGSAGVTVEVLPQIKAKTVSVGETNILYVPYGGMVFVRYSPDKTHWSSWQALEEQHDPGTNRVFHGKIEVPNIESKKYYEFIQQYSKLDVPWQNDEEAAVKWMLKQEPDFFAKHLPFVGYVQFRMEGYFMGGEGIQKIKMLLVWSISGFQSIPKNPEDYKTHDGPWRFEAQ